MLVDGQAHDLAALEGGEAALTFASGMAAVTTLLETLPSGAVIVIPDDCYAGVRILATEFLPERGIVVQRVDMADLPAVRAAPVDALIVADGTSCRHQIGELGGREPMHVARVLARALA